MEKRPLYAIDVDEVLTKFIGPSINELLSDLNTTVIPLAKLPYAQQTIKFMETLQDIAECAKAPVPEDIPDPSSYGMTRQMIAARVVLMAANEVMTSDNPTETGQRIAAAIIGTFDTRLASISQSLVAAISEKVQELSGVCDDCKDQTGRDGTNDDCTTCALRDACFKVDDPNLTEPALMPINGRGEELVRELTETLKG